MYVKVNKSVAEYYAIEDLRMENPNISFPQVITEEIAAEFDVFPCAVSTPPVVDHTKNLEIGPPEQAGGKWRQSWIVSAASPEEVAQRETDQWIGVRADRNSRLTLSDWTQLPDAPVDHAAWAEYRQQLRDVTTQSDPFNIVWPATPV